MLRRLKLSGQLAHSVLPLGAQSKLKWPDRFLSGGKLEQKRSRREHANPDTQKQNITNRRPENVRGRGGGFGDGHLEME